jgi:hypothetical protein
LVELFDAVSQNGIGLKASQLTTSGAAIGEVCVYMCVFVCFSFVYFFYIRAFFVYLFLVVHFLFIYYFIYYFLGLYFLTARSRCAFTSCGLF